MCKELQIPVDPERDEHGMLCVEKPDNIRELGMVDVSRLAGVVERLSEAAWQKENQGKENTFPVLGKTQHMIFRFTPGNQDPRKVYTNVSWDIWKPLLQPVIDVLTGLYHHREPAISKVMLARMRPGGVIYPHDDGQGSNMTSHKIHVPLMTNPDVLFYVDGVTQHLKAGMAYELNNLVKHGVKNLGQTDRVHLIFEHYDAAASPKIGNQET